MQSASQSIPISSPSLVVLAAGMGSRYGGLKQLDPIGPSGETIIDYSLYDAHRAGFGKVVFVIRKEMEAAFCEHIAARIPTHISDRIPAEYVFQELDRIPTPFRVPTGRTRPWGTAHAVLCARDVVHEPFAVINADDFYGAASYTALAQHLQHGSSDQAMVGFTLRNTLSDFGTVSRGICQLNHEDHLTSVTEMTRIERDGQHARNLNSDGTATRLSGDELVSMNMWGFTPQVFDWLQQYFEEFLAQHGSDLQAECYLPGMVNQRVAQGTAHVKVLRTPDAWFGITYREDLPRVVDSIRQRVEAGDYPRRLW